MFTHLSIPAFANCLSRAAISEDAACLGFLLRTFWTFASLSNLGRNLQKGLLSRARRHSFAVNLGLHGFGFTKAYFILKVSVRNLLFEFEVRQI